MIPGSATARLYLAVVAGGAVGAAGRHLLSLVLVDFAGGGFPWGTFAANVLGSLAIGLFAEVTGPDGRLLVRPATRQFVMIGVLGGFTTFSVFSLETVIMAWEGRRGAAALYVALSLALWVPAAWLGQALARPLNRLPRGRAAARKES